MDCNEQIKLFVKLGHWVRRHEDAITSSLRRAFLDHPAQEISKYEKALDDMPMVPPSIPEERYW